MKGKHLLDSKDLVRVVVSNVDNLTLRGEYNCSNTDIIISCSTNTRGLVFNNSNIINIHGITITECGLHSIQWLHLPKIPPLLFVSIAVLHINHVVVHNTRTYTEIADAMNLYIYNSTFGSRQSVGVGGLSITTTFATPSYNVIINNCIFTNSDDGLFLVSPTTLHNVTIANSRFIGNDRNGITIICTGTDHNYITITNSIFTSNNKDGLELLLSGTKTPIYNNIIITDSVFTENNRDGLFIHMLFDTGKYSYITIVNSTCSNNGDIGLAIYSEEDTHSNITIAKSIFTNNSNYGLFSYSLAYYYELRLSQVIISDNIGPGIHTYGRCIVTFIEGDSIIANNSSPNDGGGIHLGRDSFLTTSNRGHIYFVNNTARRYGGAIYSTDNDFRMTKDIRLITRPIAKQCTISQNLSATFINNSALKAGDILYNGIFIFCSISRRYDLDMNRMDALLCSNVPSSIRKATHSLSAVSSDPLIVCPCVDGAVNCTNRLLDREVYPGQTLHVSLATVGLCGGVSPGSVVLVNHDDKVTLISSTTTDYTSTSCTAFSYTVKPITYVTNATLTIDVADGDLYKNIGHINLRLSILPCPLGLMIDPESRDCVCDNDIAHVSGVNCNISWMPYPIQRSSSSWIAEYSKYNCTIASTECPFDYCNSSLVAFALNEPDLQCNHDRSGILCGQCQSGLSLMLGSNKCSDCTDTALTSIFIIIIAAVAGIVLVILLIVLNLTVSVGSINGVLFYANLVKLNESVFFPQVNIPVISQFISWCNLDLGIEYCFIDGLNGYIKTWLQFVFPVYIWILVILIIVGCQYSSRLSRLCGRNAVPVLATLILMSYTKLSHTVTNALMINTIQCGEHKWNVWNLDGNIDYLSPKHAVLFTVSLLFLIVGLVYTGLVFSSQWLQRYSGKCCKSTRDPVVQLKPLIDAYTGPFKDKYRFWTGLCVTVRLLLTVIFSFTTTLPNLNNFIILVTVGAMSMFAIGARVYKDKYLTVLETVSFVNIICLCITTILFTDESYRNIVSINVIVTVSVSMEMLLFVIIVSIHCYLAVKKVFNCKPYHETQNHSCQDDVPLIDLTEDDCNTEQGSPARLITYREELIFDFYLNQEHP